MLNVYNLWLSVMKFKGISEAPADSQKSSVNQKEFDNIIEATHDYSHFKKLYIYTLVMTTSTTAPPATTNWPTNP